MKAFKLKLLVGLLIIVSMIIFAGCMKSNQSGSTVDEPEITVEYLQGEYAKQLIRDGAEHVFGNIDIEQSEDGTVTLNISAKEFVESESAEKGFYIEDKNIELSAVLSSTARCTFLQGGMSLPHILDAEEFVVTHEKDISKNGGEHNPDYEKYKLYDIYIMEGQAELILARYIP